MLKLLLICLLATVAAPTKTPTTLSCKCPSCKDNHCSPDKPDGVCIATAETNTLANGAPTPVVSLGCQSTTDFCNTSLTITLNDVYWRSKTTCCSTDECNSKSISAPAESTDLGDLECPSCFARGASSCTPVKKKCAASETKCIEVAGTILKQGGDTITFVGKGCANPTASKLQKDVSWVFGNTTYHVTSISTMEAQKATQTSPLSCSCTGGTGCMDGHCSTKTPEGFCVTTAEENTLLGGTPSPLVTHFCQDRADFCNTTITITLDEVYWRSNTTCCKDKNDCNSASNPVPAESTDLGKVECPSCFARGASSCTPVKKKCAASETKCIEVAGTILKQDKATKFAGKGCATPTAKEIRSGTVMAFENIVYNITTSIVTDGAGQIRGKVPFVFLLSGLVGLLHTQFIY